MITDKSEHPKARIYFAVYVKLAVFTTLKSRPQIPRRFWESGEHRTDCMKSNEQFLEELPSECCKKAKNVNVNIRGMFHKIGLL